MQYIILDTETTGLRNPHAWSIACIICEATQTSLTPIKQIYLEFNPEKEIEPSATAVHGKTNADLAEKPLISSLTLDQLGIDPTIPSCIIGHNVAFDKKTILNPVYKEKQTSEFFSFASWFCTLSVSRKNFKFSNNKLSTIAKEYLQKTEEEIKKAHNALIDCQFCLEFLNKAMQERPTIMQQLIQINS